MVQIRKAERKKSKLRLALAGPSGSGKSLSALFIAYGLVPDWNKIGFIDTENRSGDLYAETSKVGVNIGQFPKVDIDPPYTPEKYIEAIKALENHGVEVVIIDSFSHAWAGEGGILDIQGKITDASKSGNSYVAWRTVTPMHNKLVDTVIHSKCHVIATLRTKTEYVQTEENGRKVIKKMGMAPIQRDGVEYEFTVCLDLSQEHIASTSKDRTSLFDGTYFTPTAETGKTLLGWLETGSEVVDTPKQESPVSGQNIAPDSMGGTEYTGGAEPPRLDPDKLFGTDINQAIENSTQEPPEEFKPITKAQLVKIGALCAKKSINESQGKALIQEQFSKTTLKDLSLKEASQFINYLMKSEAS